MKKLFLLQLIIIALFSSFVNAADYYWVNGTGNWSSLSNWSNSSGGTGGEYTQLPGSNDRVFFDNNSFAAAGQIVSYDVVTTTVRAFIWTSTSDAEFDGLSTDVIAIRGSFVLSASMNYDFGGKVYLNAFSTTEQDSLKTQGKVLLNDLIINAQGTYNLLNNLTLSAGTLIYERGTLNAANRTITVPSFRSSTQLSRTFLFTDGNLILTSSGLVYDVVSSSMTASDLNTANLQTTYAGADTVTLAPGGTAQVWDNFTSNSPNTRITRSFAANTLNLDNVFSLQLNPSQTLQAGTVTTGGTCGRYTNIFSENGPAIVQDMGTVWTLDYVRLKNLVALGAFVANNSFDDGGNMSWTINERPGGATYYWIAGQGNYYNAAHWSTISGGVSSGCVPGPDDIAIFDANSGLVAGNQITLDATASLRTMDWTDLSAPITFVGNAEDVFFIRTSLFGSTNLTFNWDGAFVFNTTNANVDITSNGGDWNVDMIISNTNILRFLDVFTNSRDITVDAGGINANNFDCTFYNVISETEEDINLNFDNSTVLVSGENFILEDPDAANTVSWTALSSIIQFNYTGNEAVQFVAADLIYDTVLVAVKNIELYGSNTFSYLYVNPGASLIIENSTIQTLDSLTADGDCANLIRLRSFNSSLAAPIINKNGFDTTNVSYLLIDNVSTDTTGLRVYQANFSDTINGATVWETSNPTIGTTYYWINDSGDWSDVNHWSLTSGGPAAICMPGLRDTVIFDANSFSIANQTVTVDVEAYFKVMDWSTSTNSPTLSLERNLIAADDVILENNLTVTGNGFDSGLIFQPDQLNAVFNPDGCSFGVGIVHSGRTIEDSLTFAGDLFGIDLSAIIVFGGYLNTAGYTIQTGTFTILLDAPKRVDLNASIISLAQGFSDQSGAASLTFNAGTSLITIGGATVDNYLETTNLTFYDVTLEFSPEKFNPLSGTNSYRNLIIMPGSKITVEESSTQTMSGILRMDGTCNDSIYIVSSTDGVAASFVKAADSVQAQCLDLKDITGAGGAMFKTYFSTNSGNNTGWTFDATPASVAAISSFSNLCFGDTATFVNSSTAFDGDYNNLSFFWNFGDGETFLGDTAMHVFNIAGNVNVMLISEFSNGCKDTVTESITINNPAVSLSTTAPSLVICEGTQVTFTGSTIPTGLQVEFFINSTSQGLLPLGTNSFATTSLNHEDTVSVQVHQAGCINENTTPLVYTVNPIPTMTLTTNPVSLTICEGDEVEFTAGTADAYRFYKNGAPIGAYSATNTLTLSNITNGDQYYVLGRTNGTLCVNSSDTLIFIVNPKPLTTLTQSDADLNICEGDQIDFTGAGASTYEYAINSIPVTGFIGANWSTTAIQNGDVVSVIGQSVNGCLAAAPQTYTYIVNPIPATTIASSDADLTICAGENVQFTSSGAFAYEFFIDGVSQGAPSGTPVLNTTGLTNGAEVYVQGSSSGCFNNSTILTFVVNPIPVMSLISSDADNIICYGENVDFTASGATNYQFFISGVSQGASSPTATFSTSLLSNGQTVSVTGETSGCVASTGLSFTVNPSPTPNIFSDYPSNVICEGTLITFTGANADTYEFFVDGVSQGAPTAINTFNTTTLSQPTADVYVIGYNTLNCGGQSQTITTTVNPIPTVSLASSDLDDEICQGETVTFTASGATNYQFFVNGISQGIPSTNNVFSSSSITNGQIISVNGSVNGCSSSAPETYTMTVNPNPVVTVTSSDADNVFCEGEAVTITALGATNYEFVLNTVSQGPSSAVNTIDASVFGSGSNSLQVIGETNGCTGQAQINMLINPRPTLVLTSSEPSDIFCSGNTVNFTATGAAAYDFYINGLLETSNLSGLFSSATLNDNDIVSVIGFSNSNCEGVNSPQIQVTVLPTPVVNFAASQTVTACVGDEITFTALGANNYEFFINGNSVNGLTPDDVFITTGLTNGQTVSVIGELDGCFANGTAQFTYQVFNYPSVSLANNITENICVGEPSDLEAFGADLYLFYVNGAPQGVFDPTSTFNAPLNNGDVVTVEGQTNGCATLASESFAITVYNYPSTVLTSSDADNLICLGEEVIFTGTGAMDYEFVIDGISQGISANDELTTDAIEDGQTITLIGHNGVCSAPAPQNLIFTVFSMDLGITSIPASMMICDGESITLTASGAVEYQLFINGVSQGAMSTQNSFVLNGLDSDDIITLQGFSNITGCTQPFGVDYYVQVFESPSITVMGDATFCEGDSVQLVSNWLNGNQWYLDGNIIADAQTQGIYASESGDYSIDILFGGNSTIWSFGNNAFGVFGDGTNMNSIAPISATGLADIVKVSSGDEFSAAMTAGGELWIWGSNSSGQLGIGTFTASNLPLLNVNVPQLNDLALGRDFALIADDAGNVFAWGQNEFGQLGLGNTVVYNFPQFVASVTDVANVAAGRSHALALKNDGTVWVVGDNEFGQLGNGTMTATNSYIQVPGLTDIVYIAAGDFTSFAINQSGQLYVWGNNSQGQLGMNDLINRLSPVLSPIKNVKTVSSGLAHTAVVTNSGKLYTMGANAYGQLGTGNTTQAASPQYVSSINGVENVSTGTHHTLVHRADNSVWGMGRNHNSQLGDIASTTVLSPVKIDEVQGVTNMEASKDFSHFVYGLSKSCTSPVVTIDVLNNPQATITFVDGELVASGTGESYQWYINGNTIVNGTNQTQEPSQIGNYTVLITYASGCSSLSEPIYYNPLSIEEYSEEQFVIAYPNPTGNNSKVKWSSSLDISEAHVFDFMGRLVMEKNVANTNEYDVDFSSHPVGVYSIQLIAADGSKYVLKLIKQ